MPAAIATMPSNGPVAAISPAPPPVHAGQGFLQALRMLNATPNDTEIAGTPPTAVGDETEPSALSGSAQSDPLVGSTQPDLATHDTAPSAATNGSKPVAEGGVAPSAAIVDGAPADIASPAAQPAAGADAMDPAVLDAAPQTALEAEAMRAAPGADEVERPATVHVAASNGRMTARNANGAGKAAGPGTPDTQAGQTASPAPVIDVAGTISQAATTAALSLKEPSVQVDDAPQAPATLPPAAVSHAAPLHDAAGPALRDQAMPVALPLPLAPAPAEPDAVARQSAVTASATARQASPRAGAFPADEPATGTVSSPGLTLTPATLLSAATTSTTAAAVTTSATTADAAVAAPVAAAPVAAQVAPVLLTLGQATNGTRQMTLRLHPAELGTVQIQIGHGATGAAHIEITAEKADTLQALLRDQPQLHHVLDQAGVPAAGRTITFHAAPASGTAGDGGAFAAPGQGHASGGSAAGTGSPGGGKSGQAGAEAGNDTGSRRQGRPSAERDGAGGTTSYRVGLDILA